MVIIDFYSLLIKVFIYKKLFNIHLKKLSYCKTCYILKTLEF